MSIPSDSYDTEIDSFRRTGSTIRNDETKKEDEATVPQVKNVFQRFSAYVGSFFPGKSVDSGRTLSGRMTVGAPNPISSVEKTEAPLKAVLGLSEDDEKSPTFSEAAQVQSKEEIEIEQHPTIVEQLQKIDSDHYKAVEQALVENVQPEENYIIKIRNLIAELLGQLSRIAEKDRVQIDEMKTKYKKSSFDSSVLQRELGENGLLFSAIAFGAAFIPWGKDYEVVGKIFAENCCPKIGELFSSYKQSDKQKLDGLTSLLIQEYSAKTQKGQSDSSNKQELISMLERVLQSLKEAARAG